MIKFSDLKPEQVRRICEAFARREGYMYDHELRNWMDKVVDHGARRYIDKSEIPDYPNCKNAMGRTIIGMDESQKIDYAHRLNEITGNNLKFYGWVYVLTDSTAQQQFLAVAMALGILKGEAK